MTFYLLLDSKLIFYLTERTQCVSYNNTTSVFTYVKYGVPRALFLALCSSHYIFQLLAKSFSDVSGAGQFIVKDYTQIPCLQQRRYRDILV